MATQVYKSIAAADAKNRTITLLNNTKKTKVVTTINKIFTLLKDAHS
jgi:hypothetical protein